VGVRGLAKKTGRRLDDISQALVRMKDLLDSGQAKSERQAAKASEAELGLRKGKWESLRKRFASLKKDGKLPVALSAAERNRLGVLKRYEVHEQWLAEKSLSLTWCGSGEVG
jgi:hypothetical protein